MRPAILSFTALGAETASRIAGLTGGEIFACGPDGDDARVLLPRLFRDGVPIVGTSPDGIDEAIRNAVRRASSTLRHVDWFEVTQVRGQIKDGNVEHFQVGMKIGFRLEDE